MNNFLNLLREIVRFVLDACIFFLGLAKHLFFAAKEWFLYIPVSEKIIVLNLIPSFFAASMDSASFKIADFEKGSHKSVCRISCRNITVYDYFFILQK